MRVMLLSCQAAVQFRDKKTMACKDRLGDLSYVCYVFVWTSMSRLLKARELDSVAHFIMRTGFNRMLALSYWYARNIIDARYFATLPNPFSFVITAELSGHVSHTNPFTRTSLELSPDSLFWFTKVCEFVTRMEASGDCTYFIAKVFFWGGVLLFDFNGLNSIQGACVIWTSSFVWRWK